MRRSRRAAAYPATSTSVVGRSWERKPSSFRVCAWALERPSVRVPSSCARCLMTPRSSVCPRNDSPSLIGLGRSARRLAHLGDRVAKGVTHIGDAVVAELAVERKGETAAAYVLGHR